MPHTSLDLLYHFSPLHFYGLVFYSLRLFFQFTCFSSLFSNFCPFFSLLSPPPFPVNVCLFHVVTSSPEHRSLLYIRLNALLIIILTSPLLFPRSLVLLFSSSFASSIGWLSLRSLPWSLRRRCMTTSTRGPQTTSTFRQGNGSLNHKCMALTRPINVFICSKRALQSHCDRLQCSNNTGAGWESRWTPKLILLKKRKTVLQNKELLSIFHSCQLERKTFTIIWKKKKEKQFTGLYIQLWKTKYTITASIGLKISSW